MFLFLLLVPILFPCLYDGAREGGARGGEHHGREADPGHALDETLDRRRRESDTFPALGVQPFPIVYPQRVQQSLEDPANALTHPLARAHEPRTHTLASRSGVGEGQETALVDAAKSFPEDSGRRRGHRLANHSRSLPRSPKSWSLLLRLDCLDGAFGPGDGRGPLEDRSGTVPGVSRDPRVETHVSRADEESHQGQDLGPGGHGPPTGRRVSSTGE